MNEPYPIFNEKGKIVCQICGKAFQFISPRHLKKHNTTLEQYRRRFPNIPLTTKEFNAKSKYAKKGNDLFKIDKEIISTPQEDDPVIEELDLREELQKTVKKLDPMQSMKRKILEHLRIYFSNIQQDFSIKEIGPQNQLMYEFITDFCDPILKVVFQFPDTFWHNEEANIDTNKNIKLEKHGWKVVEIHSSSPSLDKIDEAVKNF
jgi:uncharacterized Zn finger protein (UPF0148 family)